MFDFYEEKFKAINQFKYLMTFSEDIDDYKSKIYEVFQEINVFEGGKREQVQFTLEELKKYNGKNGMKAYIAINGKVYDVTGIELFNKPPHNIYTLGTDLTEDFKKCHNNSQEILSGLIIVGQIRGETVASGNEEDNSIESDFILVKETSDNIDSSGYYS